MSETDRFGRRIVLRGTPRRSCAPNPSERYLEHFDEIWTLQSQLLSEADRHGVPIIPNTAKEEVVQHVITLIINALEKGFDATPEEVFGVAPESGDDGDPGSDDPGEADASGDGSGDGDGVASGDGDGGGEGDGDKDATPGSKDSEPS